MRSGQLARAGASLARHGARRGMQPRVYVSRIMDPWLNLAMEDYLLKTVPHHEPVAYLYRNTPCVVIGKNQVRVERRNCLR